MQPSLPSALCPGAPGPSSPQARAGLVAEAARRTGLSREGLACPQGAQDIGGEGACTLEMAMAPGNVAERVRLRMLRVTGALRTKYWRPLRAH